VAKLNMFYSGLRPQTKMLLDDFIGVSMMKKRRGWSNFNDRIFGNKWPPSTKW